MAAHPSLAATLRLSSVVFNRFVPDAEARHRWSPLRMGQAGTDGVSHGKIERFKGVFMTKRRIIWILVNLIGLVFIIAFVLNKNMNHAITVWVLLIPLNMLLFWSWRGEKEKTINAQGIRSVKSLAYLFAVIAIVQIPFYIFSWSIFKVICIAIPALRSYLYFKFLRRLESSRNNSVTN